LEGGWLSCLQLFPVSVCWKVGGSLACSSPPAALSASAFCIALRTTPDPDPDPDPDAADAPADLEGAAAAGAAAAGAAAAALLASLPASAALCLRSTCSNEFWLVCARASDSVRVPVSVGFGAG
jgi:hypothetical protein